MSKRETLANYAHNAWSRWMLYLFSKCEHHTDGTVTIPRALVLRWKRQMATAYDKLPEDEKQSDLVEADRILYTYSHRPIVDEHANNT